MSAFAGLLPRGVTYVVSTAGGDERSLFLGESEQIRHAIGSRRREYAAGRTCARAALAQLGLPPQEIRTGPGREPVWPEGVVGAITHCPGFAAAAVAPTSCVRGLGIDAEAHRRLPEGVAAQVASPGELAALDRLPLGVHWPTVLFSAKESVYKLWYPEMRSWLGFDEVAVTLLPSPQAGEGHFAARLRERRLARDVETVHGRYRVHDDLVLTAGAF